MTDNNISEPNLIELTNVVMHNERCCGPEQWKGIPHPDCPGIAAVERMVVHFNQTYPELKATADRLRMDSKDVWGLPTWPKLLPFPERPEHFAETITPGELLVTPEEHVLIVDCACGVVLRVSKEPDEGAAIDAAIAQHRIQVSRSTDPGHVELPAPDWRTDVTDEGDLSDDGDGGNPPAPGAGA